MDGLVAAFLVGAAVGGAIAWLQVRAGAAAQIARLESDLRHEQEAGVDLKAAIDAADARFRDAFNALAANALAQNNRSFLQLAEATFGKLQTTATGELERRQKAVDELVKPIREALEKVDSKIAKSEQDRGAAFARLHQQLGDLATTTTLLSRAPRTPHVRGRWGEMQLRRVVEIAGMLEHCDFEEQASVSTDTGRLRPDLVIHLPGDKRIVVDAKAPLDAFLDAQETQDDAARVAKLHDHARQVRDHMDRLGAKAYQEQFAFTPELVVMFLPGETLFSAALQHDVQMIEYGMQKRVLLASPITLIALLMTIAHTWRQEALEENARDISRLGQQLHDALRTMTSHLDDLRKRIDGGVQAFNRVVGSLETNVLSKARQLKDRNLVTGDDIPRIESVDTAPRLLRDAQLLGAPEPREVVDAEDHPSGERETV